MKLLEIKDLVTEEQLHEMARVKPANTGINVEMAAWSKENARGDHWARIKVSNVIGTFSKEENFSVSIAREPEIVAGTCLLKAPTF